MSESPALDERLREVRPEDPAGSDLDAATVRVLARVAMLEAGAPSSSRRLRTRVASGLRIAAVLALALFAARAAPSFLNVPIEEEAAVAVVPTVVPQAPAAPAWLLGALAGDPLARQVALRGGPSVRLAMLDYAESDPGRTGEALSLLRAAGGIRDDDEAARLRRLAERPGVRATAIDLLGGATSTAGVRHLGLLLVDQPDAEALVVDALTRAARRGRRTLALNALLAGAQAGRMLAAAEAMRLVQGRSLDRLLDALPEASLTDARLAVAVRDAPATTRDRLIRGASGGDVRALRLAVEARLKGVVPILADLVHDDDEVVAAMAVTDLVRQHRPEAWYHVARATVGPGADAAQRALRDAPRSVLVHLERTARDDPRRRVVAVAGLAAAGSEGFLALERLATQPALRPPVIHAAEQAVGDDAVDLLAVLVTSNRAADRALLALGARVARGDERAGRALLVLARGTSSRQAVRLLARYGEALGATWLEQAAADDGLPASARASLLRALRRMRGERADGAGDSSRRGVEPSPIT